MISSAFNGSHRKTSPIHSLLTVLDPGKFIYFVHIRSRDGVHVRTCVHDIRFLSPDSVAFCGFFLSILNFSISYLGGSYEGACEGW